MAEIVEFPSKADPRKLLLQNNIQFVKSDKQQLLNKAIKNLENRLGVSLDEYHQPLSQCNILFLDALLMAIPFR